MGVESPAMIYGFTNPSEFIAELYGNPAFQDLLSFIPPMDGNKFKSLLHEVWDFIVEFLNNLLGEKRIHKSALDQAKELGLVCMKIQENHLQDILLLQA